MVVNNNHFLVKADRLCDRIPVVSTLTNLTVLFQKCVVLPFMKNESVAGSHYYTHLKNKPLLRSVVLLLPLVGNIAVGIYDFLSMKLSDKDFALWLVSKHGEALAWVDQTLRNDRDVVLAAVRAHGLALKHAHVDLQNDEEIVGAAIEKNNYAFRFAGDKIRNNKEQVRALIEINPKIFLFVEDACKKDRELFLRAVTLYGYNLLDTNRSENGEWRVGFHDEFKDDQEIVFAAVLQNPKVLEFDNREWRKNKELARLMIGKYPFGLSLMDRELQLDPELQKLQAKEVLKMDDLPPAWRVRFEKATSHPV